jgi:hypothetical protein
VKKSILKILLISTGAISLGVLGFLTGIQYQRQALYQSYSFQIENTLDVLEHLRKGDVSLAEKSLETSIGVGIYHLPQEDALMTKLSKTMVNRALNGAKCYEEKYAWQISPEFAQTVNRALKAKLLNEKCL